jgi:hypothetical protein
LTAPLIKQNTKKAKLPNALKLSFIGTTYLCHAHGIGSKTHHVIFEKHEKVLYKERGLSSRFLGVSTFLIEGAREVNINFRKIKIWLFIEP